MTTTKSRKTRSYLDEEIAKLIKRIRDGEKTDGIQLTKSDCNLLITHLQCCVNIVPLVEALHGIITQTVIDWKMMPTDEDDNTLLQGRRNEQ